ncbi:MAG: phosphatase PAP2 family protein [Bacteroidetes bacterium HGW-Bacteroidetes-21]|jgi:undecaprenyl-diphosphatase|nr:MAG: phosphatase PAP2 family protein [Bacteroidetes bacterium HGW-Bacteroidetes-21]
METLIQLDKSLFLFLNSLHSSYGDTLMWIITSTYTWIPLYALIVFFIVRKYKIQAIWIILFAILSVAASDLISVHLFKEVFCRLRPSHNPEFFGQIHIVNDYKGGTFGFVSSHAANSFAIAVFTLLIIKRKWYTFSIILWALIVCYSRIYLGVHYPADIIGGAVIGILNAYLFYKLLNKFFLKKTKLNARSF